MNLTVLSFFPNSAEFDLSNSMLCPPAALTRTRAGCSFSRITILSRMSWSTLYGTSTTPPGACACACAPPRARCGDGDDGVCGDVFAVTVPAWPCAPAAAVRRSMTACAMSSMSSMCAWNWRPQSPALLSVAAIWCAELWPGRSGDEPRSKDSRSAAR